jgi:hypothetical protein
MLIPMYNTLIYCDRQFSGLGIIYRLMLLKGNTNLSNNFIPTHILTLSTLDFQIYINILWTEISFPIFFQTVFAYLCIQGSLRLLIECEGFWVLWGLSPDLIIFISSFFEIILNRSRNNHFGIRWCMGVSLL